MRLEPHPLNISPNDIKPSDVLRAAERGIPQASTKQAPKVSTVSHIHLEEIGTEDVLLLGEHIAGTQFGIDNHHSYLSLVVCVYENKAAQHCQTYRKKKALQSSFRGFSSCKAFMSNFQGLLNLQKHAIRTVHNAGDWRHISMLMLSSK
ncbi:hypothetical protein OJAV_G00233820 [Oryzias javanicus]|uniref:Uncharacterized protein n=1 Tax=Oryzias javanicus TaxID=123683 RepID=A0A3S2P3E4_ORYJA|nr:hypothetical protein OJAV_G00233820 [Oryzias javanicus]